jgi:hypothetical protein
MTDQIMRATYEQAKGAHEDAEALLPLLALLEDDGEPSPIMMILTALGDLAAAIQAIDARLVAIDGKISLIAATTASTPPC